MVHRQMLIDTRLGSLSVAHRAVFHSYVFPPVVPTTLLRHSSRVSPTTSPSAEVAGLPFGEDGDSARCWEELTLQSGPLDPLGASLSPSDCCLLRVPSAPHLMALHRPV